MENAKKFGTFCGANPTISIVNAAEKILGKYAAKRVALWLNQRIAEQRVFDRNRLDCGGPAGPVT